MKTTLKLILAAAATASLLADPAAAKTANHAYQDELTSAPSSQRDAGLLQDCVHVAFPQCTGGN